ncbi:hypothetical protein [Neobacillus sp. LXY-4]|uniref:hypothetical protein n=1 Tax=Neobacillus sp. LXY-4 TaxID=3379826 RepID=UPI003EDECDBB
MKEKHKIVPLGMINVCAMVLPGAIVRDVSNEDCLVKKQVEEANILWQKIINGRTFGVKFELNSIILINQDIKRLHPNAENISFSPKHLDQIANSIVKQAKKLTLKADLYIVFMDGDSIGPILADGTRVLAISFIDYPIIIMSNTAAQREYILAHEIGHFLFNNNRYGNTADPDPIKGDSAHNAERSNLMHPTGIYWPKSPNKPDVTVAQILKALETRFFYQ